MFQNTWTRYVSFWKDALTMAARLALGTIRRETAKPGTARSGYSATHSPWATSRMARHASRRQTRRALIGSPAESSPSQTTFFQKSSACHSPQAGHLTCHSRLSLALKNLETP